MKKVLSCKKWLVMLALLLSMTLVVACNGGGGAEEETEAPEAPQVEADTEEANDDAGAEEAPAADGEVITISFFNTSAEINAVFEEMFERYHELNPNVIVELIPTGIGGGQQEQLQALYASGNAPTILNVDPANVIEYSMHLKEFTPENAPWLFTYASDGVVEAGTFDGQVLGAAWSVQGYGLLYNRRVVHEIFGDDFDPDSINTQDALREFMEEVEAAGVSGTLLHGANWSMGGHFLTLVYALQGPATTDGTDFLDNMMAGTQLIEDSPIFHGLLDSLDILIAHNYNSADPLVADYNRDVMAFGEGESATFFMGDWAWSVMGELEGVDTDFGFLPVPWSNDPSDYGNREIVMVIPKLNAVDMSNSTPEQQQAAFDFLGWMSTDPEGQQFLLDAGFFMPYTNVRQDMEYNSMVEAVAGYANQGRTINLGVFSYITGDAWTETGNLMLQYVAGLIDRQELADGINAYWQNLD